MRTSSIALLFSAALAVGCGSDTPDFPETATVTGTLTQGGKPVEGASITFVPQATGEGVYPASAATAADGSFTATTFFSPAASAEGAVPGDYTVIATKAPPVDPKLSEGHAENPTPTGPTNLLPAKYSQMNNTPLKAKVEAGKDNTFEFKIE